MPDQDMSQMDRRIADSLPGPNEVKANHKILAELAVKRELLAERYQTSPQGLFCPESLNSLVDGFVRENYEDLTRRWIGVLLLASLEAAPTKFKLINPSRRFALGSAVSSSPTEDLRLVAGALLHLAVCNGNAIESFFATAHISITAFKFTNRLETQWVEDFEECLETLESPLSVALADGCNYANVSPSNAEIYWAVHVTVDDIVIRPRGGHLALFLESDGLKIATPPTPGPARFVDVLFKDIVSTEVILRPPSLQEQISKWPTLEISFSQHGSNILIDAVSQQVRSVSIWFKDLATAKEISEVITNELRKSIGVINLAAQMNDSSPGKQEFFLKVSRSSVPIDLSSNDTSPAQRLDRDDNLHSAGAKPMLRHVSARNKQDIEAPKWPEDPGFLSYDTQIDDLATSQDSSYWAEADFIADYLEPGPIPISGQVDNSTLTANGDSKTNRGKSYSNAKGDSKAPRSVPSENLYQDQSARERNEQCVQPLSIGANISTQRLESPSRSRYELSMKPVQLRSENQDQEKEDTSLNSDTLRARKRTLYVSKGRLNKKPRVEDEKGETDCAEHRPDEYTAARQINHLHQSINVSNADGAMQVAADYMSRSNHNNITEVSNTEASGFEDIITIGNIDSDEHDLLNDPVFLKAPVETGNRITYTKHFGTKTSKTDSNDGACLLETTQNTNSHSSIVPVSSPPSFAVEHEKAVLQDQAFRMRHGGPNTSAPDARSGGASSRITMSCSRPKLVSFQDRLLAMLATHPDSRQPADLNGDNDETQVNGEPEEQAAHQDSIKSPDEQPVDWFDNSDDQNQHSLSAEDNSQGFTTDGTNRTIHSPEVNDTTKWSNSTGTRLKRLSEEIQTILKRTISRVAGQEQDTTSYIAIYQTNALHLVDELSCAHADLLASASEGYKQYESVAHEHVIQSHKLLLRENNEVKTVATEIYKIFDWEKMHRSQTDTLDALAAIYG